MSTRASARIRTAFGHAAEHSRAALIAYVLAGYPTEETSAEAAIAALDEGADLLEIGVPFSDPVADGPSIADAGREALSRGSGLGTAVRLVAELRAAGRTAPVLVMSYLNPLLAAGTGPTLAALSESGADGIIVPDLPAGADTQLERLAAAHDLATSFLVAPNTPANRIHAAAAASTGFLYVVPLLGVTGARDAVAERSPALLTHVRELVDGRVPVAAGFGLKTAEQVTALAPYADGLVVGSALVDALRDGGVEALRSLVRGMVAATGQRAGSVSPG